MPKPTTRQEAVEQAQKWGREYSHWNICTEMEPTGGEGRLLAMQACAVMDAMEVVRLCALAQVLPAGREVADG